MKNYFEALNMVFKPLGIYQGSVTETVPDLIVEFENGGKGMLFCSEALSIGQKVEVIVSELLGNCVPAVVLTTDCCNTLKIKAELVKYTVVAVSNIGIIAMLEDEYVYYTPQQLAYEHTQLKPGDCINCLISRYFPDRILQILESTPEVVVPEFDEVVKFGEPIPLKEYGFDKVVYNEAKKYASLDSRNKLKLGYCYSGQIINNYARIGSVLADVVTDKRIDCRHNEALRVVNIPPSSKRRIEVEIIE